MVAAGRGPRPRPSRTRTSRAGTDIVLDHRDGLPIHEVDTEFTSSRVDRGEDDCALLRRELNAEFLVTDDLRALPELRNLSSARVAILLRALV